MIEAAGLTPDTRVLDVVAAIRDRWMPSSQRA
jgi:hypothetical protein